MRGGGLFDALRRASEINSSLRGTMGMMAAITGGKYLSDTNDMTVGLKNAFEDLKASYTLGFYAADADDKWHPLEVRVKRPGLTVRSRQGWIAESKQRVAASSTAETSRQAIEGPLGSSAILMSARCQPASNDAAGTIELILRIDANSVVFERDNATFVSSLDVATVDRTAEGVLRPFVQQVTVSWDAKQLAVGRTQGIVYVRTWKPQADVTAIRVMVRDRNTGEVRHPRHGDEQGAGRGKQLTPRSLQRSRGSGRCQIPMSCAGRADDCALPTRVRLSHVREPRFGGRIPRREPATERHHLIALGGGIGRSSASRSSSGVTRRSIACLRALWIMTARPSGCAAAGCPRDPSAATPPAS